MLTVGMTDYYRDRVRHGGIYSDKFVAFWWYNQVRIMQYGLGAKNPRRFRALPISIGAELTLFKTAGKALLSVGRFCQRDEQ